MSDENNLSKIWVYGKVWSSELRIDFSNDRHYALELKHKPTSPQEVVKRLIEMARHIETEIEAGLV